MWAFLLIMALAGDLAAAAQTDAMQAVVDGEVYRRPVVPPYEPPSDFGRRAAEGDGGGARSGTTHADRSGNYLTEVDVRRLRAQALLGPLDGVWRLVDEGGEVLLELSVTDRGPGYALAGVWRGSTAAGATRTSSIVVLDRTDDAVILSLSPDIRLDLRRTSDGWAAALQETGRVRVASLDAVVP